MSDFGYCRLTSTVPIDFLFQFHTKPGYIIRHTPVHVGAVRNAGAKPSGRSAADRLFSPWAWLPPSARRAYLG